LRLAVTDGRERIAMTRVGTMAAQVRDAASMWHPRRITRLATSLVVAFAWCCLLSAAAGMVMHLVG
jgi:hypothetical protein